jgi:hypothetical protein
MLEFAALSCSMEADGVEANPHHHTWDVSELRLFECELRPTTHPQGSGSPQYH